MTVKYQFLHMKNHEWMEDFVLEKLEKLARKYPWANHANVFFKVDKAAVAEQNTCEIELSVPGPKLFAKTTADTFETSVIRTVETLGKLLKKRKAKMYQH